MGLILLKFIRLCPDSGDYGWLKFPLETVAWAGPWNFWQHAILTGLLLSIAGTKQSTGSEAWLTSQLAGEFFPLIFGRWHVHCFLLR